MAEKNYSNALPNTLSNLKLKFPSEKLKELPSGGLAAKKLFSTGVRISNSEPNLYSSFEDSSFHLSDHKNKRHELRKTISCVHLRNLRYNGLFIKPNSGTLTCKPLTYNQSVPCNLFQTVPTQRRLSSTPEVSDTLSENTVPDAPDSPCDSEVRFFIPETSDRNNNETATTQNLPQSQCSDGSLGFLQKLSSKKRRPFGVGRRRDGITTPPNVSVFASPAQSFLPNSYRRTKSEAVIHTPTSTSDDKLIRKSSEKLETNSGHRREDNRQKKFSTVARNVRNVLSFFKRRTSEVGSICPNLETVQLWSENFQSLLNDKYGLSLFRSFLCSEYSEENIEFWICCEEYRSLKNRHSVRAQKIYSDFITVHAPREVNLDSTTRSKTMTNLNHPDKSTFDLAQSRIQNLMEKDSYPRFLRSTFYTNTLHRAKPSPS